MTNSEASSKITLRAIILAIFFTFLGVIWIQQAGLITYTSQLCIAVPPIPVVAAIVFLVVANAALKKLKGRWSLARSEILVIYSFLVIAVPISSLGIARLFFPFITASFYFATPENQFARYHQYFPRWLTPDNPETIRTLYEGAEDGSVPWQAWGLPLLAWSAFFLILFFTMLCIMVIIRRQWVEKEKLTFPILYMPLEVTEEGAKGSLIGSFFRNPIKIA